MIQSGGMKWVLSAAAGLLLLGGLVLMTDPMTPDPERLAAFIPPTIGPYLSEADQTFDAETIFDYIDGAGEVYRSYNMVSLVARRFIKDGKPDIVVDAFDMGAAADAFGVFTHDLEGQDAGIGQGSSYKAGLLSFWKDRYFLSVYAEEETAETRELVLELGRRIARAIPAEGAKPALLGFLPAAGLDPREVRFFHNFSILNSHYFVADTNVLMLDQTTAAVLAPYGGKGRGSRLLIVAYADAGSAAKAGESFARAYMPEAGGTGTVKTENGRWTAVRLFDRFVVILFDGETEAAASGLLDEVGGLIGGRVPGDR
jgi:hypothetical protein